MTIRTKNWLQTQIGRDLVRGKKKVSEFTYSTYQYLRDLIDSSAFQDSNGDISFAVYWEDLRFPATAINPPGQVADPDFDVTEVGWLFDAGGTEILYIIAQLPHSYDQGTDLRCHVHWEPTNTNTGNVLWRMSYRWRNNGEVAGVFTDIDILTAGGGVADALQMGSFASISKSNALISSIIDIKLQRIGGDASDTYNADARLKEFDIHYQSDTHGSRQELVK